MYCGGNDDLIRCEFLNSSGTMIDRGAWSEIGTFDEKMFIDHVETDWCLRAVRKGYKLYGSCSAELFHSMGDQVCRYWLLKWRTMPYRNSKRHYYLARNSVLLYKREYTPRMWIVWNMLKLVMTLFYFGIFPPDRIDQFKMIVKGVVHGIKNKTGPLSE